MFYRPERLLKERQRQLGDGLLLLSDLALGHSDEGERSTGAAHSPTVCIITIC